MKVKKIKENGTGLIKHPDFGEVRTVVRKGEPWFVAKDVCAILGISNHNDATSRLDDDEKSGSVVPTHYGDKEITIVSESGLYHLVFISRKPEAKAFRKWVTSEVLPAIRKTGYYVHPSLEKASRQNIKLMSEALRHYVTDEDTTKVAKKFGVGRLTVSLVKSGAETNNAIMQELQRRALANKDAEINAYEPERVKEIVKKLNS